MATLPGGFLASPPCWAQCWTLWQTSVWPLCSSSPSLWWASFQVATPFQVECFHTLWHILQSCQHTKPAILDMTSPLCCIIHRCLVSPSPSYSSHTCERRSTGRRQLLPALCHASTTSEPHLPAHLLCLCDHSPLSALSKRTWSRYWDIQHATVEVTPSTLSKVSTLE